MAHFWDEFSKSLAQPVERRESLRRLGIALTATVLGPLGVEYARAGKHTKPPKPPSDPCKTFCNCGKGRVQDQCVKACKACGSNPDQLAGGCGNYHCCGYGTSPCGNNCVDAAWDPNNCGACGNACTGPDPHCFSGVCSECGPGRAACGNSCVDLAWDPANCGTCGNACGVSTPYCSYGACAECPSGYTKCPEGGCVDLYADVNNCGACGNVCSSYCYYGICDYYYGGGGGYGGYGGWGGWYGYGWY
jgi:hypothetical protein